jgi:hypothetical protein
MGVIASLRGAALLLFAGLLAGECLAWIPDKLRDPEDGALDASDYLLRHRGVLPAP